MHTMMKRFEMQKADEGGLLTNKQSLPTAVILPSRATYDGS